MFINRIPLAQCALAPTPEVLTAFYRDQWLSCHDFSQDVAKQAATLIQRPETQYALYYDEAYPFAVMLFALWHSHKSVWIVPNNKSATAEKLIQRGCCLLGDWPTHKTMTLAPSHDSIPLSVLDTQHTRLTLFTSGSTGESQAIEKALWQCQAEIDVLEQQWGTDLARAQVAATVSHQHIYGLLFRILWPLASGRCFHSRLYLSPESLLNATNGQPAYWVASPAQLKRLDELSPWTAIKRLQAIFSSGGPLELSVAQQIQQHGGQQLIDIYGSSETGGIAWRKPVLDEHWQTFPGIRIVLTADQSYQLHSPYLPTHTAYFLNDHLELNQDGCFSLLGRTDRVVKVEEKRLSLNEMENALQQSEWVQQAHCRLQTTDKRERIAAIIALTTSGRDYLTQHGRAALVKHFKNQLLPLFETVVTPKKWLFLNQLPLSPQGKIDHLQLHSLLSLDNRIFPQLQYLNQQNEVMELSLRIQPELRYFTGHFPGFPILPGVTQLAWVENYGKLLFAINRPFLRMEVIKFKKIICPGEKLTLHLKWHADNGKLYFDFSSTTESHSSGRLVYEG